MARSIIETIRALEYRGIRVIHIDYSRPVAAGIRLFLLGRHTCLHIVNASRLRSVARRRWVINFSHGQRVLFLHGIDSAVEWEKADAVERQLITRMLSRFDVVWVNNEKMRQWLVGAELHSAVECVSPFPAQARSSTVAVVKEVSDGPYAIVAAAGAGEHYGIALAMQIVDRYRREVEPMSLCILLYGEIAPAQMLSMQRLEEVAWVRILRDVEPAAVSQLISSATVVLRPTERDGDSMFVREALALGARVVASDVVPRPAGVEVSALSEAAFFHALRSGGEISDGAGLGAPVDCALVRLLELQD